MVESKDDEEIDTYLTSKLVSLVGVVLPRSIQICLVLERAFGT